MRKINIGVSVAPPNVVHTSPYMAKDLGSSPSAASRPISSSSKAASRRPRRSAAAQGSAIVSVSDVAIGRGMKVQQFWGLAPRMPQAYMVPADDQEGRRPQGQAHVGHRRRRRRLQLADGSRGAQDCRARLSADASSFRLATAGRLPGLIAGQIDGVALHPEDVFLARKQKSTLNLLVQLVDLMPNYQFNSYGASADWIARDRPLLRDTAAAMIEANRTAYRDKAKVLPIIVKATEKPAEAVDYAIDVLTKNCVWSINTGFDPARTQWTIDNSVANGDIPKDKKPSVGSGRQHGARQAKPSKPPAAR